VASPGGRGGPEGQAPRGGHLLERAFRSLAVAVAAAGVLLAAQGCQRTPPKPRIDTIRIAENSLRASAESGVGQAQIDALVRAALVESGFDVGPGDGAWHARLEILGVSAGREPSGGRMQLEAKLELELTPGAGGDAARRELGTGRSPVSPPPSSWRSPARWARRRAGCASA
jgi:hypothetical protein